MGSLPQPPGPSPGPLAYPVVKIDGVEAPALLGFRIVLLPNTPARCWVEFDAPALEALAPSASPALGKPLAVSLAASGSGAAPEQLFLGRILGLGRSRNPGQAPRVEVEASDALQLLAMTRRSRVFQGVSPTSVIHEVAQGHALSVQVTLPPLPEGTVVQADESDLSLLRRLAGQTDSEFWDEGSTLHVAPFGDSAYPEVSLSADAHLLEYRIRADLSGQRAGVEVRGWDPGSRSAIVAHSVSGPGADMLAQTWESGNPPTEPFVHLGPFTPPEAHQWATARARSLARGFVELEGTADAGAPLIRPRTRINLTGVGPELSGRYRAVACQYTLNSQTGLRTEFRALRWDSHPEDTSNA